MKRLLQFLLFNAGLEAPLRFLRRAQTVILMYHGFTDQAQTADNHLGSHLHASKFAEQIAYLSGRHPVIALSRLIDSLSGGKPVAKNSVVITIDDGYRSNYTIAYPILKRAGLPATVFAVTDFVENREPLWPDRVSYAAGQAPLAEVRRFGTEVMGLAFDAPPSKAACESRIRQALKLLPPKPRTELLSRLEQALGHRLDLDQAPEIYHPLTWAQINEMAGSGLIEIGSHTHTHSILTRCGEEEAAEELRLSKDLIEERTSRPCPLFCYPNGYTGDFDERTGRQLRAAGYSCGLTTVSGFNGPGDGAYELRRFGTDNNDSHSDFRMTFSAGRSLFSSLRRWR